MELEIEEELVEENELDCDEEILLLDDSLEALESIDELEFDTDELLANDSEDEDWDNDDSELLPGLLDDEELSLSPPPHADKVNTAINTMLRQAAPTDRRA